MFTELKASNVSESSGPIKRECVVCMCVCKNMTYLGNDLLERICLK